LATLIKEIDLPSSPIDIFQSIKNNPYPFLLESQMDPSKLGRFSFMGSNPFLVLKNKGNHTELIEKDKKKSIKGNPFHIIKNLLSKYSVKTADAPIPFIGGAVGYFSYDMRHHIEKLPSKAVDDLNLPDCILCFYDLVIAIDHLLNKAYISSTGLPERDEKKRKKRAKSQLCQVLTIVPGAFHSVSLSTRHKEKAPVAIFSNFTKPAYLAAIEKAKDYIASGDIYQVNLSQRFSAEFNSDPFELYRNLRSINPAPFAAYLDFNELKIISSSPERFLCLRSGAIHTRPIKGTRPRGKTPKEDTHIIEELLKSPKDRAEHIMIVDLERNDLGRVSKFGSVSPTEFVIPERYATVSHLVSTVKGILRNGVDSVDCLLNCFPGGSITGAPKIRSMQIIDELEPTARSVYTGSIGYLSFDGSMDTSIVIRTILLKENKLYFQVGGGIVADSDPEAEYQETLDKAQALKAAVGRKGQHEVFC